jgi:methylenetetrahydrofolate--tRNA-(uracil-5-)-methyltransferase
MRRLDSLIMAAALATRVPAGKSLAVDRELFAAYLTRALEAGTPGGDHPGGSGRFSSRRQITIAATGPLTSEPLAQALGNLTGQEHLHFYDAIAPIVAADSLDMTKIFRASRYGAGDDYLNCPFSAKRNTPPFMRP